MAIAAHFTSDQRDAARRTLLLEALGKTANGDRAQVVVHNISRTGLLLETGAELVVGETIALDLPEADNIEARVVWISDSYAGCQFVAPISAAALSAAQLRGEPQDDQNGPTDRPTVDLEPFPAIFARLRKARGLTLAAIAHALDVSKPTVWAWEQGKARPVEGRLETLAQVLGVERAELTPDRETPRLHDSAGLAPILLRSRHAIASALGIRPERVKISIEL